MTHWHYQLMKHNQDGEEYYAVHEYYDSVDGDSDGYTENPIYVEGDTVEGVKEQLSLILQDIEKHGVKEYV